MIRKSVIIQNYLLTSSNIVSFGNNFADILSYLIFALSKEPREIQERIIQRVEKDCMENS